MLLKLMYDHEKLKVKSVSCVQLFLTLWTVAHQASLSMGFSRQNTGVGCHFLLQILPCKMGQMLSSVHSPTDTD